MNRDQIEGKWLQLKGEIKRQWGKLTDDQIDEAEGNLQKLEGQIQEAYGKTAEEARKEIEDFERKYAA
ncbi:MAG: CsbD family protein [Pseudomonadota bacterium]